MGKSRNRKWFDKGAEDYETRDRRDFDSRRNAKRRKQHVRDHIEDDEYAATEHVEYGNYGKHR